MRRAVQIVLGALLLSVCMVSLFLVAGLASGNDVDVQLPFGIRHYDAGKAPNFTLEDIEGEPFSLDSTRGRWVFLHFWASWCGPCVEEMPAIQRLADALEKKAFKVVMVNTADEEDNIFEFLGRVGIDLNSLMDADGLVTEQWQPRGLPTTFIIDPNGYVKYQAIGGRDWTKPEYVEFIWELLKQPVSKPQP